MQRTLFIMRHAQAEEINSHLHDKDRELTSKGQQEALQMGTELIKLGVKPDYIYTSIAKRTQQTASLISDVLKLPTENIMVEEELYNSSIRTYLGFINQLDSSLRSVILIGHNPAVSYLAEYLSGAEIGSMPTAGICLLSTPSLAWKEFSKDSVSLQEFIFPDQFNN